MRAYFHIPHIHTHTGTIYINSTVGTMQYHGYTFIAAYLPIWDIGTFSDFCFILFEFILNFFWAILLSFNEKIVRA